MHASDFEIDPAFIAEKSRFLRKHFKLTQDNLAEMSGLTTRTIEKIESAKHAPQMASLELISNALGFCVSIFRKPTADEEERLEKELERAKRKTVIAQTKPIRAFSDFLQVYGGWHARRVDFSQIKVDTTLEFAAEIDDFLEDLGAIWDECYQSQRIEYAKKIVSICTRLEARGYLCHIGSHLQRQIFQGRPDLVFRVGIVSFLPKEQADGDRYAVIQLESNWETMSP